MRRALVALTLAAAALAGCGHRPATVRPASTSISTPRPSAGSGGARAPRASKGSAARASAGGSSPSGSAAAPHLGNRAFRPILPLLRPAGPTPLLPTWLPPLTGGRSYYFSVRASATTYSVEVAAVTGTHAPNSLKSVPQADLLAVLQAGAAGVLGPSPAFAAPAKGGVAEGIALGVHGLYYPQRGGLTYSLLRWRVGGWTYEVADTTGLGAGAPVLLPYARSLVSAVPAGQTPVPGVGAGTVAQALAPDNAAVWVLFTRGPWHYRIEGYNAPALQLARTMGA